MNNGNFSKIKWVVLCICLLAGGFFLLKNLNMGNGFRTDADATGETAGTESDPESAPDTERDAETTAASAAKGCSSAAGGLCAVLVLIGAVPVTRCRRKDD